MRQEEKGDSFDYKKSKRILLTVFICFIVLIIGFVIFTNSYNLFSNSSVEVKDIYELNWFTCNGEPSRTSSISPLPQECVQKSLNNEEFNRIFKNDNFELFLFDTSDYYAIYDGDNNLISITLTWYFDNNQISMILDTNNYPEFLFAGQEQKINGYDVAAQKSMIDEDNYEIDIGIRKSHYGIWIFGNRKAENEINELYRYIVIENGIDFSNIKNE